MIVSSTNYYAKQNARIKVSNAVAGRLIRIESNVAVKVMTAVVVTRRRLKNT